MGHLISWIIFGLIAGLIAKAIHPGKDPGGWIVTSLIGIGGAFLGRFVAGLLNIDISANWSFMGFLFAIGGAVVLLFIYQKVFVKKAS
ncbi:GlsB/YeaQ/YmgE family stress response membrane protein [Niabella hirudinis]|uniref:GlsB/YeaQ/YmgE family stress response membrane protein n=1 Tax=Niabella hirudinis TaxID=1285929 RepID=UPI003EBC9F5E